MSQSWYTYQTFIPIWECQSCRITTFGHRCHQCRHLQIEVCVPWICSRGHQNYKVWDANAPCRFPGCQEWKEGHQWYCNRCGKSNFSDSEDFCIHC